MTIRDPQKHQDSMWDWTILKGCFGGKISPSDIDGVVEHNGHFLFMECKGAGVPITQGQSILLANLSKQPRTTVVVAWGDRNIPIEMLVAGDFMPEYVKPNDSFECDLVRLRRFCSDWYSHAHQSPRVGVK